MLHPQARALLDLIAERGVPPTHTLSPQEARAVYRDRRGFTQPAPPPVASVQSLQAEGPLGPIPLRLYRPLGTMADQVLPALVYYHGGGWVIGDLDTHDHLCRLICRDAAAHVLSVDYRLAPEHKAPAAVDDAYAAYLWAREHAVELGEHGIDVADVPQRVAHRQHVGAVGGARGDAGFPQTVEAATYQGALAGK